MALVHDVDMTSKESCVEGFVRSYGEYPPRQPVPSWWFEVHGVVESASTSDLRARALREALLESKSFDEWYTNAYSVVLNRPAPAKKLSKAAAKKAAASKMLIMVRTEKFTYDELRALQDQYGVLDGDP